MLNLSHAHDGFRDFSGRAIVNQGVVNWHSAYLRGGDGSSFTNAAGATFHDQNASGYSIHNAFGGTFTFANAGTYRKSTSGTTTIQVPFTNTGTILVEAGTLAFSSTFTNSGGSLLAAGGSFSFSGGLDVGTGTLGGTGTITGNVTAGGLVSPGSSPGQLTIAGNLTLLGTSTTLFELGGTAQGTGYDFLNVTGTAALDGTLQVKFVNGFQHSVQPTDTFTLLSAASRTGVFANVPTTGLRLFSTDGFASFDVNYTASALTLSNFVAIPEPSTWVMLAAGALLVLAPRLRRRR